MQVPLLLGIQFWSGHHADGPWQGVSGHALANPLSTKAATMVSWVCQLLPEIHH